MVLIFEVPLAAVALVLSVLSFKTLQTIKHLGVGKSFWIPVLTSGIFFFVGSILAILNDLGFSFAYIVEISSISRLLALCTLLGGIYIYSRTITKNLGEKFMLPHPPKAIEIETEETSEAPKPIPEKLDEKKSAKNVDCKFNFGYLQTLSKSTPIPDECLSCDRIIECKHTYLRKPRQQSTDVSSTENPLDMQLLDSDLEEETTTEI